MALPLAVQEAMRDAGEPVEQYLCNIPPHRQVHAPSARKGEESRVNGSGMSALPVRAREPWLCELHSGPCMRAGPESFSSVPQRRWVPD